MSYNRLKGLPKSRTICLAILVILLLAGWTSEEAAQITPVKQLITGVRLLDVAWSPDGQLIAVAGEWGIKVFDPALQEAAFLQTHIAHLPDQIGETKGVAWSPDSRFLASAGGKGDGTVRIWSRDLATNTFTRNQILRTGVEQEIYVSWSPDGAYLASIGAIDPPRYEGDLVGSIEIWDTQSWSLIRTLPKFGAMARALTWSPGSTMIAGQGECYATCSNTVLPGMFVFEVSTGNLVKRINTNYFLGGVAWSSTDLIAVANSVQIDIYNSDFDRIISLEKYTEIKQISWSTDGGKLAWYDDSFTLHVTDLVVGNILDLALLGQFSGISWKNDGQAVVSVTLDGRIEIFDIADLFTTSGIPTLTLIPSHTAQARPTPIQ